ncbi:MAG: hypothetical protein CVV02_01830 [Firmicutes bacterium HGW-Firmicutes-7]|nr:MAG: hypothetical protein CVV02_01830 [Firmicutes bacterium HGW-Firmicutes-7]
MSFMESVIMTMFDIMQFFMIISKLRTNKGILKFWHVLLLFVGVFIVVGGSRFAGGQFTFIFGGVFQILWLWVVYKKLEQSFFLYTIGLIIIMMIQTCVLVPLFLMNGGIDYTFKTGLIVQNISIILTIILVKFVPINILYNYIENKNQIFKILCINIIIVIAMIIMYWSFDFEGIVENFVLIIVLAMLLLIITMIFLKNGLKNINAEEQVRIYEQYNPIVDELVDELRVKHHDFDNHLLAIKLMIEMNKNSLDTIGRVEAYIDEIEEDFRNSNLIKLNNKVVAGFLYSKRKWACNNNIELNIVIDYYDIKTSLKDYELIEILSILIDNAFETGVENNAIVISIKKENNKCVFEVLNRYPYLTVEQINEMFKKGYSTKNKQGRGLGLYKLRQIIDKNQGEVQVSNTGIEDNFIAFKVILPK